jgi:hypothetical protein
MDVGRYPVCMGYPVSKVVRLFRREPYAHINVRTFTILRRFQFAAYLVMCAVS